MMATADPGAVVKDLTQRLGALGTALISRDGLVGWAQLPPGMYAETFGVLCATVFGAAAAALRELGRTPPERIVLEGPDVRILLVPSGGRALLVVVLDRAASLEAAIEAAGPFAALLASSESPIPTPGPS
jgi:predicted regulator of Ras-like GTPase activity (Roadblock/LC7/MglB family)